MNKLNHVAFIMDGNGRWGKQRNKGRNFGHLKGVEVVKKIVTGSIKLKIPIVTFYVFSSENWKRPKREINYLFKLIKIYFSKEIESIIRQGIKINIIGEMSIDPKFGIYLLILFKIGSVNLYVTSRTENTNLF